MKLTGRLVSVSNNSGVVLECCGEEGAEPQNKAFNYQSVYVPNLTWGHLGSDKKNGVTNKCRRNLNPDKCKLEFKLAEKHLVTKCILHPFPI